MHCIAETGDLTTEFDSEITLLRKLLKTQAKFRGWEAGIRSHSRGAEGDARSVEPRQLAM